jgi:excisionase family DNA binding protein
MKYLCPKEVAAQFGISERTVQRMMAAGYIQAFRIGAKLWRTDQASLDDYINTGQYGRYRRQLGPLRPMPGKPDDLVPACKLEIHLVGEADEPTNCVAEIGADMPDSEVDGEPYVKITKRDVRSSSGLLKITGQSV